MKLFDTTSLNAAENLDQEAIFRHLPQGSTTDRSHSVVVIDVWQQAARAENINSQRVTT
jgi:hypothetical protein